MNAETDAYYGKDEPSATYKWGVVVQQGVMHSQWQAVAWFKTQTRAVEYARESRRTVFAIARFYAAGDRR